MKLTPKIATDIETFVKGGASIESAAASFGVPLDSLNKWLTEDPTSPSESKPQKPTPDSCQRSH